MENVCVELENIEVSFLDKVILNIPRLAMHQFDRIGIVGKNGAGKSTLLKLIANQIEPNKGKVKRFCDFAYFDQLKGAYEEDADYALMGRLSVPKANRGHFSGGEHTRLKLATLFSNS